jgi:hypothetical protein
MLAGIPVIHGSHDLIRLMDGNHGAFGKDIQPGICDNGGDFDNLVILRIQTRHLQVYPDQIVGILRHVNTFLG